MADQKEPVEVSDPCEFECPLTNSLFTDPVLADDGHTYDYPKIKEWLAIRQASPLTNQPMKPVFIRSVVFHRLLTEYCQANNRPLPEVHQFGLVREEKASATTKDYLHAIKHNHLTELKNLLRLNHDSLEYDKIWDSVIKNNRQTMIKEMLKQDFPLNAWRVVVLGTAIELGFSHIVDCLLDNIFFDQRERQLGLISAIKYGHLEVVKVLITSGVRLSYDIMKTLVVFTDFNILRYMINEKGILKELLKIATEEKKIAVINFLTLKKAKRCSENHVPGYPCRGCGLYLCRGCEKDDCYDACIPFQLDLHSNDIGGRIMTELRETREMNANRVANELAQIREINESDLTHPRE